LAALTADCRLVPTMTAVQDLPRWLIVRAKDTVPEVNVRGNSCVIVTGSGSALRLAM
jgi:hypothetical protein